MHDDDRGRPGDGDGASCELVGSARRGVDRHEVGGGLDGLAGEEPARQARADRGRPARGARGMEKLEEADLLPHGVKLGSLAARTVPARVDSPRVAPPR